MTHHPNVKTISYSALNPGKHLLVLGAIHGDETCGPEAIKRVIAGFENHRLSLQCGKVTFVPVCNPEAYRQKKRFIDRNLNRSLYPKQDRVAYEDHIDPILCPLLAQHDLLLDLHSYQSPGKEFAFIGTNSAAEIEYCRSLGVDRFVYGWSEAFSLSTAPSKTSIGTTEYAREHGALAITVECGQHENSDAADIGVRTILHALRYAGILGSTDSVTTEGHAQVEDEVIERFLQAQANEHDTAQRDKGQSFVKMAAVYHKAQPGEFARPWRHFDRVKKGELLATYHPDPHQSDSGAAEAQHLVAPYDAVVILPKATSSIGSEWFYLGKVTDCPEPIQ